MKTYCVHVYPAMIDYESIEADSPEKAKEVVLKLDWPDEYESIDHIEVMRQCDCGYDNDTADKKCAECGVKL